MEASEIVHNAAIASQFLDLTAWGKCSDWVIIGTSVSTTKLLFLLPEVKEKCEKCNISEMFVIWIIDSQHMFSVWGTYWKKHFVNVNLRINFLKMLLILSGRQNILWCELGDKKDELQSRSMWQLNSKCTAGSLNFANQWKRYR